MKITPNLRKKITEEWFSYLQVQICKEFEFMERNKFKFSKRIWKKKRKSEGGGISFLLTGGKIFDKVGVTNLQLQECFQKIQISNTRSRKTGKYWASGISVENMKNPKIPAIHFNTRFIVTSKEWFGGGIDVTPSHEDLKEKEIIHKNLKRVCSQKKKLQKI